ncbi:MAG TPA: heparinase II/III family protein, partial [Thermomicrobiales bacterium]|nr:heparinase II/III family protein [Thermomicrobiales bacterium]
MTSPSLYTTPDELLVIRARLREHAWYARCFDNLRAPADELLRRGIEIPHDKGFVFYETCPADNTPLRMDPFKPHEHVCPTCGQNYTGEPYDRAWISFYQMYLSQRAVEMGIAYQVTGDPAYAEAIRFILGDYARHYEAYPLEDCVLGPTRLFQSTYIESLWLASLTAAADLVRERIPDDEWRLIRDELMLPAARVILDYDEGDNNRQAMNNVAIGFVGVLCDEPSFVEYALRGPHGWMHHLEHSVLADGLWYEGDNYHFATLPAMANLADAMSRNGVDLYRIEAGDRTFKQMFDGPLLDLYPDLTFPARKDSRFGSPIAQRWYAGLYELAYRQYGDPAYGRLLRTMYARGSSETRVLANAAGFIDVLPGAPADRERLDWRGFLNAVPDLGTETGIPVRASINMTGTGLGILRQNGGETYASIDYGHYGGGHGHPDRLQLNFYARGHRWLADWGTGNYYFDHLRWYRSTVGHNTVVVDGRTQLPVTGESRRFGVTPDQQVIISEVNEVYPGVRFRRVAVLLSPDLLLDRFEVEADRPHRFDWVIHPDAHSALEVSGLTRPLAPAQLSGEHYDWLQDICGGSATGNWQAVVRDGGDALAIHLAGVPSTEVFTASAYGPPDEIPHRFPVLIARRMAERTTFTALHEHRAGERPLVESFQSTPDGGCQIQLGDGGSYECQSDTVPDAVWVTHRAPDGALREASGFGVSAIPGVLAADFPLEHLFLWIEGDLAHLTVPDRFGQVCILTPNVERVAVNGAEPIASRNLRQPPDAWTDVPRADVYSGVVNRIDLAIRNYRDEPLTGAPVIVLPSGWKLVGAPSHIDVAPGASAACPLEVEAGSDAGTVSIGLTGDQIPVAPVAPISIESWYPNLAGSIVRMRVINHTPNPQSATVRAGSNIQTVTVDRAATVDLPITWAEAELPLSVTAECGAY